MGQTTKVTSLASARTGNDLREMENYSATIEAEPSKSFDDLLKQSSDSVALRAYLVGYPAFKDACHRFHSLIGTSWHEPGKRPVLIEAMDAALRLVHSGNGLSQLTYTQIQTMLVTELTDHLSVMANYDTVYINSEGELEPWVVGSIGFAAWLDGSDDKQALLLRKPSITRVSSLGLRVRLLSMVLDNDALGMALMRRF